MAINAGHPIGQYCKWAILPSESLNEQVTGTVPTGADGSIVTLPQGDAYVPGTGGATWASSAAIDPFVNDLTIVYYGRLDASFSGSMLAQFVGGNYGWELKTSFWDGSFPRIELLRAFWGNGSSANLGGAGDDIVHHLVLRINKAAATLEWILDGNFGSAVSWAADGTVSGGAVKMYNTSSSTNACITLQIYNVALSNADITSLASDPTQIFAAPPQDLSIASLSQGNSASTGEIGIAGILYGSALSQTNSASSGQITRAQDLTASSLTQGNAASNASINPYNRLRTLLRDVPLNTWVKVNTTKYVDCQMPLADRPVGYPNSYDHVKIVIPWSSIAFDHTRGHLLLWGGGHANYTGNQLYQWLADTGEWSLSCLPSKLTADAYANVVDKKAPQSSHTYQNNFWLENNDMFGTFGGAAAPGGSTVQENNDGTQRRVGPWLYDLTKTDPEKVGGSDGSGMDPARLGLNAWQHRRDNVPTGVTGIDAYPIDYAEHVSQATVSIAKDGKDYAIFTMDGSASGFPTWYRYEFGNMRLGEDDQCIYLGRSTQGNLIIREGWMVYDSKREFVYRNGYNKDTNYPLAELVVKNPWVAGIAETAIRLVNTSDGTTFTNNPVSDDCPYGATYDATNDCLWLWAGAFTGSNPDAGAVYRINIPEYDSSTGWASTTWTVDEIVPAGDRPVGHHQQPVLGKIKHVPEIEAFLILDRAEPDGSLDSASVWTFKTAQIQGDLLAANLNQSNSTSASSITVEQQLSTDALTQVNTAGANAVTQVHALAILAPTQAHAESIASIAQIHNVASNSLIQQNTASDATLNAVVINLASGPIGQSNSSSADAIGQVHNLAVSGVTQTNAKTTSAITQVHTLVTVGISQTNILPNGTLFTGQLLAVVSVSQGNTVEAIAVAQKHILAGQAATQSNTVSTGIIASIDGEFAASAVTQINAFSSGRLSLTQIIIIANLIQGNAASSKMIGVRDGAQLKIDPRYVVYRHHKNYIAKYGGD